MRTTLIAQMGSWAPSVLNASLAAGLIGLYAFHTQTHQVGVYGLLVGLTGFFLAMPWYPTPTWRWMKYLVVLLPSWVLLAAAWMVFQESVFQKADFFFMAQFTAFFFLQNFFLYLSLDKNEISTILVGIGAIIPLVLTYIWAGLQAKDPYTWPLSEYAAFHFTIILVVILLNVLSVTSFLLYVQRRAKTIRKSLKQEIQNLHEVQEVYYLYENFLRIKQILSDPTPDIEDVIRRVFKALTEMSDYDLLQKGAFFLTEPHGKSLRMVVQYNADNLLQTCMQVPKGRCLCGRALATGEAIYKSCVDHEHEIRPEGMKPHGHYVLPIRWEGEVLGVFTLYIADGAPYSARTQGFLWMVADAIAKRLVLHRQSEQLREQIREITAGHRAAAGLLQALLPAHHILQDRFPGKQALWYQPADEIGGDFYFFYERGDDVYFGVGDAEGHGVPGAILAAMLMIQLRDIIHRMNKVGPAELIRTLHKSLVRAYGETEVLLHNGSDIALYQYDRRQKTLRYAGARLPLLYSTNGNMQIVDPVPAAIGTERFREDAITDVELAVPPEMRLYLMSDGIYSQLSRMTTQSQAKFGRRRLYEFLEQSRQVSVAEQSQIIRNALAEWQGTGLQTDDITLWIIELGEA